MAACSASWDLIVKRSACMSFLNLSRVRLRSYPACGLRINLLAGLAASNSEIAPAGQARAAALSCSSVPGPTSSAMSPVISKTPGATCGAVAVREAGAFVDLGGEGHAASLIGVSMLRARLASSPGSFISTTAASRPSRW